VTRAANPRLRIAGQRRKGSAQAEIDGARTVELDNGQNKKGNGASGHPLVILAAVIGAIATLTATIGALVFSTQSSRQATQQFRQAQVAQASERFSRSVEQLGSQTMAVRIGAAYSFGRLMRDSNDDQQSIVEILSSFISLQLAQAAPVRENEQRRRLAPDVLAAVKVLDAQPRPRERKGPDGRVVSWPSMQLQHVNLARRNLISVAFRDADLTRADLGAADLSFADLRGARLFAANLRAADLRGADLNRAALFGAELADANLGNAHLNGADLSGAHLTGANLYKANLPGADLRYAYLNGADLTGADLTGANLGNADLNGADLTGADLTGAKLGDVDCSASTKWPEGLTVHCT
jgi:uncharacterized protein YjbI with pentapeptide repeats